MLYEYIDFNNRTCLCDVERFDNVFFVTELPINCGASITNCIEILANRFVTEAHVKAEDIIVVEHYVTDIKKNEATFDKVSFDIIYDKLCCPKWESITAMDYVKLISDQGDDAIKIYKEWIGK